MPTADRRAFVPRAVAAFLAQSYEHRELLVLDDGEDPVEDVMPADDERVRYVRLTERLVLGAKRNLACSLARGDVLVHWDDDDLHALDRVERQVAALEESGALLCGSSRLYFVREDWSAAWLFRYPGRRAGWLAGGTFAYRRALCEKESFAPLPTGSDSLLALTSRAPRLDLDDTGLLVAILHAGNTAPKDLGPAWRPCSVEDVPCERPADGTP